MEEYTSFESFKANRFLSDGEIKNVKRKLNNITGISGFIVEPDRIQIEFYTYFQSKDSLKKELVNAGFPLEDKEKSKSGVFGRFIQNLAKSNLESFGNKRLDCCDLRNKQKMS